MCNVLEAKHTSFENPLDRFFSLGKMHTDHFFLKEVFDVVFVALRSSLSNSSNLKCLGDLTTEVRKREAMLKYYGLPIKQSLSSGPQNSGRLFLFCPFPSVYVYFDG